jgi:hypothetical protein
VTGTFVHRTLAFVAAVPVLALAAPTQANVFASGEFRYLYVVQ